MSKKKGTHKDSGGNKPATVVPKSTQEQAISDEQLDEVSGGLNPQPLPPRIQHSEVLPVVSKTFQR